MPANLTFSLGTLYSFLLVLLRVGGAIVFIPLPGVKNTPEPVRAAFALGFTLALAPCWPAVDPAGVSASRLLTWVAAEAAVGLAVGVVVSIVLETFVVAAQILGLQAGYAYASTIDPNTQADSGILLVFAQLAAGLLFFSVGLDREVLRLFARSLETVPPGAYVFGPPSARLLIQLGANLFSFGLRLAFPVLAVLILVDVALALLGRINAQLQLLSLAFPAKMLLALLVLSWGAVLFPRILREMSEPAWAVSRRLLGI
jgi:flagellar biosynthetic protein FliR